MILPLICKAAVLLFGLAGRWICNLISTSVSDFCYVYILRSLADKENYVGMATDLRSRVAEHQAGRVRSTKARRPFELIYYEACRNTHDAAAREKYLKSAWGKRYIKSRLRNYLAEPR